MRSSFESPLRAPSDGYGLIRCKHLIWAAGLLPARLFDFVEDVTPTAEGKTNADDLHIPPPLIEYVDFDPNSAAEFTNRRLDIYGKGNSAMETLTSLMPYAGSMDVNSYSPPRRSASTHYSGDVHVRNEGPIGG